MCALLFIYKYEVSLVFIPAYYFLMRKYIFVFLANGTSILFYFFLTNALSKTFKHTLMILLAKL